MSFYGFEYFSGANVIVKLNGHSCLEAAGISYSYLDSRRPIYGYSSVYFDAVASGQKIVQGSLVINYVYDNYLFDCIKKGLEVAPPELSGSNNGRANNLDDLINEYYTTPNNLVANTSNRNVSTTTDLGFDGEEAEVLSSHSVNYQALDREISRLQKQYWKNSPSNEDIANAGYQGPRARGVYGDPLMMGGGVNISIDFGNRGESLIIETVNFVGRGSTIQIDENVIVEEYNFFARRLRGSKTTQY